MIDEKKLYRKLKDGIKRNGDRIERIEHVFQSGVPDVNMCINGVELWIEIKAPKEPKRPKTPLFGSNHKLSNAQMNWMLSQLNAGGRGWIFIGTDKGNYFMVNARHADYVNNMTVADLFNISSWSAKDSITGIQWSELRQILIDEK